MASLCFATQKAENSANIQDFETKYIELQRGIWYNFSISNRQFFTIKKREGCIRGMKAGKGSQGVAAVCMLVIGAAVAYGSGSVYQKIQSAGQGTPVDISGKNSGAYQVEGVWKKSDDSYMVHASAQGFQSEIQMEVLFDASGEQIQQVKVLAQGDTEGIGSKITEDSFAATFAGVQAPVQIKDMVVASPVSDDVTEVVEEAAMEEEPLRRSNPNEWNPKNKSAEANAVRALYASEMLDSSLNERPLTTAFSDMPAEVKAAANMEQAGLLEKAEEGFSGRFNSNDWNVEDRSAEANAVRALYASEMLDSSLNQRPLTTTLADFTPEAKASARMEQAGLLEKPVPLMIEVSAPAMVSSTSIDGVSGATISSKGAATAVNNAYFFLKEELGN